ncbi:hypothetical protein JI435_059260 [Parastagonospora nodorum SN15]|uniref:Uncharacterized protein n=1 Tax=Phaeosphaeria nodorum (strain SN15 / ATCC MYA-4574 / FGSC 10173) TaxID=321614 RepID=A0A7U2I9E3_PHANO|nr:hypothetical protein JI435_059260 [Parastagonospora nodorum SN15]
MRQRSSRVLSQDGGRCAGDTTHACRQACSTALDNRRRYRAEASC